MHAACSSCREERAQRGGLSLGSRVFKHQARQRWPRAPRLLAAWRALGLQRVPAGAAAIPLGGLRCLRRVRQRAGQPGAMAAAAVGARGAGRWLAALRSRGASGAAMVSGPGRAIGPSFGWVGAAARADPQLSRRSPRAGEAEAAGTSVSSRPAGAP